MNTAARYASLVKFSHTIFAMPFALASYVYALTSTRTALDWVLLVKIVLCMVFARNAAMGFNRWADRRIDAANPRTAGREIPSGKVSPRAALVFTIANGAAFLAAAAFINDLTLVLAPAALFIVMGYSYTKRFTVWSHIVLGVALAIAPVGAYIAVAGGIAVVPIVLGGTVITWTAGFDILYSLQDARFDRENGLKSVPARFSAAGSTAISVALHAVSVYGVVIIGILGRYGWLYWAGAGLFTGLLVMQHVIYRPSKIDRIGQSFGLVNGLASCAYALFFILEMLA